MKTILVDAVDCFVSDKGEIFNEMNELLDSYPNKKIILTGANYEKYPIYNLDKMPYEVFTLQHDPEKTDPQYYKKFLTNFGLETGDVVYFEHNPKVVDVSNEVGIRTYFYDNDKKDLVGLKKFLDENL